MQTKKFREETLDYVFLLQQVQERKKFDFVETVNHHHHQASIFPVCFSLVALGFNVEFSFFLSCG